MLVLIHTHHMENMCFKCRSSRATVEVNMQCDWCKFEFSLFTDAPLFMENIRTHPHQWLRGQVVETVQEK
jgi:hypothetical protein